MTLINHLPPFFRSLNARVKYFFFLLSPTLIVFISINCDFPRPTISRRRVDGYIFYYFPTKLDVFFPPRKKLSLRSLFLLLDLVFIADCSAIYERIPHWSGVNTRRDSKYIKHFALFPSIHSAKTKVFAKNKSKFEEYIVRQTSTNIA